MKRTRKIVIIAHCLLNVNAKVEPLAKDMGGSSIICKLIELGYGIIQLPCIEMAMFGSKRWGLVYEQCNFPAFREQCQRLLHPIVQQLKDYKEHGYSIEMVIGVDGSPTCGINFVSKGNWFGEFNSENNYQAKIDTLHIAKGKGVMMEVLENMFKENGISTLFYGIDEREPMYEELIQVLNQKQENN